MTTIESLPLNAKARRVLADHGVTTVDDLRAIGLAALRGDGVGSTTLVHIAAIVSAVTGTELEAPARVSRRVRCTVCRESVVRDGLSPRLLAPCRSCGGEVVASGRPGRPGRPPPAVRRHAVDLPGDVSAALARLGPVSTVLRGLADVAVRPGPVGDAVRAAVRSAGPSTTTADRAGA